LAQVLAVAGKYSGVAVAVFVAVDAVGAAFAGVSAVEVVFVAIVVEAASVAVPAVAASVAVLAVAASVAGLAVAASVAGLAVVASVAGLVVAASVAVPVACWEAVGLEAGVAG